MSDLRDRALKLYTYEPELCMEIAKLVAEQTMASRGLTARQQQLFQFIANNIQSTGIAPSYSEMAAHLGLASRGRINALVLGLEERGAIRRLPNRARAIEIIRSN